MPVECAAVVEDVSLDAFRDLDYVVMGHSFGSHNEVGRLADEFVYQSDLYARLASAGVEANREVPVRLSHREFSKTLFLDLVAATCGLYELKAVRALNDVHRGQLLTYLCLLDLRRGKLINFGEPSVQSEFVNAPMTTVERRDFTVAKDRFRGPREFLDLIVELLRDWGTCLTLSLYREAVCHFLGGIANVEKRVPLRRGGVDLGTQRFDMASKSVAFRLTAFKDEPRDFEKHLQRLLRLCSVKAIHWVNIKPRTVTFKTIVSE